MSLRLTNATDYAVLAMVHMACLPEDAVVRRTQIALAHGIPSSFVAKVLCSLVRAQLLLSIRGARGGFCLARPASEITLLEIVEAIEGPLRLTECMSPSRCALTDRCAGQPLWVAVQAKIAGVLRAATLEELVSTPRRRTATAALRPAARI